MTDINGDGDLLKHILKVNQTRLVKQIIIDLKESRLFNPGVWDKLISQLENLPPEIAQAHDDQAIIKNIIS